MTLLLGTPDGLYVAPDGDTAGADRALDVAVNRVRRFEGHGVLAATEDGVYRSVGGREWDRIGAFDAPVESVLGTPDGTVYAGTRPAAVYRSSDGGETWTDLAVTALSDAERWADRSFRGGAAIRTLAADPGDPGRLFAGIEPGGVVVTADGGERWTRRAAGCHDDVHHLLGVGPATLVASTGNGLYWTDDAGETWRRADTDFRDFWANYHREAAVHDGRLFTAARSWGPEAPLGVVFEHDGATPEETPDRVEQPGSPEEFVLSFANHMDRLLAGTMAQDADGFRPDEPGRVVVREPSGEWRTLGRAPGPVKSLVGL